MNVVDSCGWLEFFADGPNAAFFEEALADPTTLVVPSICLYEVFKRVLVQRGERAALEAVAPMQRCLVVDLTPAIALKAAAISHRHKLPMADSIVLATAQECEAVVWTQDDDFAGIPDVKYKPKA
jgi:predicted nucleic acid-binding protein